MAITFPTTLDSLTNPTASDATNSVSVPHATQHSNLNDAVEALEARVGIVGSAVTSSLTYRIATVETVLATQGAFTTWTPVWTQTATPTFTNSASRYHKVGRLVSGFSSVTFTSAGTASGLITCTLPVTGAWSGSVNTNIGKFLYGNGSGYYEGSVIQTSASGVLFVVSGGTNWFGANPAQTIANTHTMSISFAYESAS